MINYKNKQLRSIQEQVVYNSNKVDELEETINDIDFDTSIVKKIDSTSHTGVEISRNDSGVIQARKNLNNDVTSVSLDADVIDIRSTSDNSVYVGEAEEGVQISSPEGTVNIDTNQLDITANHFSFAIHNGLTPGISNNMFAGLCLYELVYQRYGAPYYVMFFAPATTAASIPSTLKMPIIAFTDVTNNGASFIQKVNSSTWKLFYCDDIGGTGVEITPILSVTRRL